MEEKKTTDVTRKLVLDFEKKQLSDSIMLQMRRLRIPFNLRGADLLKGVVYGKIRHPEITIEHAVKQAVDASRLPGGSMTTEDGFYYLMEVIEIASKEDLFQAKYSFEEQKKLVEKMVDNILAELEKQFCYSAVCDCLNCLFPIGKYSLFVDIIKCMLFKKIYAPESTFDCMLEYAERKVGNEIQDKKLTFDELLTYVSENQFICGETNTDKQLQLQNLIKRLETWIYDKYPSYEVPAK